MSYSNDMTQIRAGLVSYLGAAIEASHFDSRAARHSVVSMLTEESLNLSKENADDPFDLYVLKPMIRGIVVILSQRISQLSSLPMNEEVKKVIAEYNSIIENLTSLINNIK